MTHVQEASPKKPTDAELAILGVIWGQGAATVRGVFQTLSATQDTGYTTVLKLMQIMTDKGLLECDKSVRPQVYKASKTQNHTQKMLLRELLDRAFSGSPGSLVLQALAMRRSTPEELQQIRDMLDKLDGDDA